MIHSTQKYQLDELVKRMIEFGSIDGVRDEAQTIIVWYNRQMDRKPKMYEIKHIIDHVDGELNSLAKKYSIAYKK